MTTMEHTFNRFTKKIHIKASIEKLYLCWSTSHGITKWFLSHADYTTSDGTLRNPKEEIQGGINTFGNGIIGAVKKKEPYYRPMVGILLNLHLATDEETKMNLYNGCSCGWTFWLANLKAFLEHGILLNERDVDLTDTPQAGHIFVNM